MMSETLYRHSRDNCYYFIMVWTIFALVCILEIPFVIQIDDFCVINHISIENTEIMYSRNTAMQYLPASYAREQLPGNLS